uniref:SET domain-containing protein n=1 Tax=viral metagenome TaxID=1070528 RepID=A0A6C0I6N8_9ZZZZ
MININNNRKKHKQTRRVNYLKKPHGYLDFVNTDIYQQQGKFGMGTYAGKLIPEGSIIIKEHPHNLDIKNNQNISCNTYHYKLIKHLFNKHNKKYMDLVPLKLDDNIGFDENTDYNKKKHMKYFPELTEDQMKLYFMKYKHNVFLFNNQPSILFFSAKINHSCEPNCIYYKSNDNCMIIETIREINYEEELFIPYIDFTAPKEDRQKLLKDKYGFDCSCEKCNREI